MTHFVIPTATPISELPTSKAFAIDISGLDAAGDYISLSLPEFPGAKLDFTKTFIDITSNEEGKFDEGPTDVIAFSEFSPALKAENKDQEGRFPISLLKTIDKSNLTGVRLRVYAKEACTFRCLSIRAIAEDWTYAPIDVDTLWHHAERPPSTNGAASQAFAFPTTEEEGWPKEWPIIFRADNSTGTKDPRPVNISLSASFRTGSLVKATGESGESSFSQLAFYFRDVSEDDKSQVELDTWNQARLNVLGHQPDFTPEAEYIARTQESLDIQNQEHLDKDTQFILERSPDFSTHSWLEVKLKWCKTNASNTLTIHDADGEGYSFSNIELEKVEETHLDKGQYVMFIDLEESSIRVQIFHENQAGQPETSRRVFDSGKIVDDALIKRRKGRFGWWAQLLDGDAYVQNIRTRGVNYGEMVSKEFQSITPVKGVSLYAGSTKDTELVEDVTPTSAQTTITVDPTASSGGKAIKVVTTPLEPLQGFMTNEFEIDDPNNLAISFDIKFPSTEVPGSNLTAFLIGKYEQIVSLNLPPFTKDVWSHVKAYLRDDILFETGNYRLVLLQSTPVVATTWYVENLSVRTSAVKWSARSYASDAWNMAGERWQPADFTLNSLNGGIVFAEPGNGLQVRAQVFDQAAEIHDYKAIPQYATLGRPVWSDEFKGLGKAPKSLSITPSKSELTVTFTGSAEDEDGQIVAYYWSFGDDTYDSGKSVKHTYERSGTYVVTLTVTDDTGNATSKQESVTVP